MADIITTADAAIEAERIECDVEGHPTTWIEHDPDAWYPPPCPWCQAADEYERHRGCAHSHHGRWRRWKITHRVILWLTGLGVVTSHGIIYGNGCKGCAYGIRVTGRRRELLWVSVDAWRCLLRYRHIRAESMDFGLCSKCVPCPECGSKTAGHRDGCVES